MAAAFSLLLIAARLLQTVHWGGIEPNLPLYIGFALFCCTATLWVFRAKEPSLEAKQLWCYLRADYPLLRILNYLHAAFLCCALVFACTQVSDLAGRVLAYCCDFAGQYELAERVYSSTADRYHISFGTASGRGSNHKQATPYSAEQLARFENDSEALDRAVENVYGPCSFQLAIRFRSHAGRSATYDVQSAIYKKSLAIFQKLNAREDCLIVLPFLAYAQFETGDRDGMAQSLAEVSRLVSEDTAIKENLNWASLKYYFEFAQDKGIDVSRSFKQFEARRLLARSVVREPEKVDYTDVYTFLFCIALLPTTFVAKRVLLSTARFRWQRQLQLAQTPAEFVERSDKLIVLELFTRNIARAELYSRQSLSMAESMKVA